MHQEAKVKWLETPYKHTSYCTMQPVGRTHFSLHVHQIKYSQV